jgi:hypothetical protein
MHSNKCLDTNTCDSPFIQARGILAVTWDCQGSADRRYVETIEGEQDKTLLRRYRDCNQKHHQVLPSIGIKTTPEVSFMDILCVQVRY